MNMYMGEQKFDTKNVLTFLMCITRKSNDKYGENRMRAVVCDDCTKLIVNDTRHQVPILGEDGPWKLALQTSPDHMTGIGIVNITTTAKSVVIKTPAKRFVFKKTMPPVPQKWIKTKHGMVRSQNDKSEIIRYAQSDGGEFCVAFDYYDRTVNIRPLYAYYGTIIKLSTNSTDTNCTSFAH